MSRALAHTGGLEGRGHDLVDHLRDVAGRARKFAEGAKPDDPDFALMAAWAGWLHDLGKYRDEFQQYLVGRRQGGVETQHSVFGAARARSLNLPWAVVLAVLGHHAGLPSYSHAKGRIRDPKLDPLSAAPSLAARLDDDRQSSPSPWPASVAEFLSIRPELKASFDQELSIRVLFSCLVDADYLDTERYMTGRERVGTPFRAKVHERVRPTNNVDSNSLSV